MRVLIATARYVRTPDGHLWTPFSYHGHEFWTRYLNDFEGVDLLARCRPVDVAPEGYHRATGEGVSGLCVPDFHTPLEMITRLPAIVTRARRHLRRAEAIILRSSSDPFISLTARLIPAHKAFGVEVIGDPFEVYSDDAQHGRFSNLYKTLFRHELARQCHNASATAYVTTSTLQRRYPPHPGRFTTTYSSINLPDSAFRESPRQYATAPAPARLVSVGGFETRYKGQDLLLRAVRRLVDDGLDTHVSFAGDGALRPEMEQLAAELDLSDRVQFLGMLHDPADVFASLDGADLFVLPSRTDAMPRSIIEAMARGLPCVGTHVGGIPEMLDESVLVPSEDDAALAAKIHRLLNDPQELNRLAQRNREHAERFRQAHLDANRRAFYQALIAATGESD